MGQEQSKGELLYQQVSYGNAEGIKALRREGASLEWMDREGKTPLIVACMNPELYDVTKTLIGLGANVNAYRPGRNAGTPLHHAAKRGLERIVKLLLLNGVINTLMWDPMFNFSANPLILNDDCQTALDIARAKGLSNVVRALEGHLCLFSGWLREFHGPGFLEVVAPQLVSRKVWVVVLPVGSRNLTRPFKLELAIYSSSQDAQPRTVISLWKANSEEPKLRQSDPSVTIVDNTTKARIKLGPANENDKQQLKWFSDACKAIPQPRHPPAFLHNNLPTVPPTAPPAADDLEMAMAINASIQSAMQEEPPLVDIQPSFEASSSSCGVNISKHSLPNAPNPTSVTNSMQTGPGGNSSQHIQINNVPIASCSSGLDSAPSAPLIDDDIPADSPINYPSIDLSPVNMSSSDTEKLPKEEEKVSVGGGSSCVICLDAPSEGACIPCGHVAGCMSCLNEIKAKKWGCPVCRAKINQVIKLYHV